MKLRCAVVDDEPLARGLIESYVKKTPFLELAGCFSSAVEVMEALASTQIDLLFLDIQMPGLNGLELAGTIDKSTKIIFTTAFNQYAIDGFKANALDYLLKPVSYNDFLVSANRALEWFSMKEAASQQPERQGNGYIFVKSEYRYIQVRLQDIIYIEGLKDYVKIYCEYEDAPILSLMSMKSLESLLPEDEFIRVHRSFIVRKDKIKVVERGRILFGDKRVPVGDSYKDIFQKFLENDTIYLKRPHQNSSF